MGAISHNFAVLLLEVRGIQEVSNDCVVAYAAISLMLFHCLSCASLRGTFTIFNQLAVFLPLITQAH